MTERSDSAGQPFAGRAFEASPWTADDGTAPPAYLAALAAFRAGEAGPEAVVDALRGVRLLVPLLAEVGETGETASGHAFDKRAELALVTVAGPDGRKVLVLSCNCGMPLLRDRLVELFDVIVSTLRWSEAKEPVPA